MPSLPNLRLYLKTQLMPDPQREMNEPEMTEDSNGDKTWRLEGKLHRIDGPAIEYADGSKSYWIQGELHRTDGPAIERADGSKQYFIEGKRHRTDGPAIENANGSKQYWVEGKLHRTDGPAFERADGSKEYWVEGKRHRKDGPAIEDADGTKSYWIFGEKAGVQDFIDRGFFKGAISQAIYNEDLNALRSILEKDPSLANLDLGESPQGIQKIVMSYRPTLWDHLHNKDGAETEVNPLVLEAPDLGITQ